MLSKKVLLLFFDEQQPRREKNIYNVLRGVSTVSNLFWAQQYRLLEFWRYYPHLELSEYTQIIQSAINSGELIEDEDGKLLKKANSKVFAVNIRHGLQAYFDFDKLIQLVNLSVQVVSELSFQNKRYSPSIDDTELLWQIKIWLKQVRSKQATDEFVTKFQSELSEIGSALPKKNAMMLFNQFVGHQRVGFTVEQLATTLSASSAEMEFQIRETFLEVVNIIERQKLPLLSKLISLIENDSRLTHSALISWNMFKNGLEIPKIAGRRRIKENTVREHLMMASILEKDFPFEKFIKLDAFLKRFSLDPEKIDKWSYQSVIQEDQSISFFIFRLAQIKQGQLNYFDNKRT